MPRLLHHPTVRKHASQLWKFILGGGIGTILDLITVSILIREFQVSPYIAYIPSTIVGATFVFFVNKFFTFKNRGKSTRDQAMKFALVYGTAFCLNLVLAWGLLWVFTNYLFPATMAYLAAMLARVMAIGLIAIWNYSLSHGFIFKEGEMDAAVI